MRQFALALATLFTALTAQAQTPPAGSEGKSSAREEQRQKMRVARQKAAQACKSTRGEARHDCMQREMCAQTPNPARCKERVAKIRSAHHRAAETCKSAQPDKRRECMRHEMCAQAKDPAKCEARAKQRAERRNAAKPSS